MNLWQVLEAAPCEAPAVLSRAGLPPGAWTGLTRDGAYRPIGWDLAVRADLASTPTLRVRAFTDRVPARATVGWTAAAWVHTGGRPPARLDLLVPPGGRRVDPRPDLLSHEAALGQADVVLLDGVRVTSVQRTGLDLARHLPAAQSLRWLRALLASGFDPGLAQRTVRGLGRERGVRCAQAVLAELRP